MADIGVDYAGRSPGGAAVKAAGFDFVARYLSRYTAKVITAGEYQDMLNNGVGVVVVFEDYANQALKGYNQGVADAQFALNQARSIGWPDDRPIYFAVDFDINDAQKPVAGEYMKGVHAVIGLGRTGAYGGYWWIKYCAENGLSSYNWQAVAWSGGNVHPAANLFQRLGGTNINGTDCDINDALKADYGQNNGVNNMAIIQDADNWRNRAQRSFQTIRGRDMGPGEFEPWIGQDFLHLVEALEDSQEADAQIDYGKWGRTAKNDHWDQQIADANSKVQVLTDERDNVNYPKINAATQGLGLPPDASADSISKGIADLKANGGNDAALQLIIKQKTDENKQLTTNITKLAKENDDLQKQVDSQNPSKLNSFGKQLMALIKKFGLKK